MTEWGSILLTAGFGGFMLNVMNLWEDHSKAKADRTPKDGLYWFFFAGWPIFSAGLAYVYLLDGSTLRPFLAFSVGVTAPTTLKALMSTVAAPSGTPRNAEP